LKDDEEYSLPGTTWEDFGGIVLKTIKFDQTTCTYTISSTVLSTKTTLSYDYTIVYPKVYMESQTSGYAALVANQAQAYTSRPCIGGICLSSIFEMVLRANYFKRNQIH
jgi:hypothetical protein